jgi:hypothetical protein
LLKRQARKSNKSKDVANKYSPWTRTGFTTSVLKVNFSACSKLRALMIGSRPKGHFESTYLPHSMWLQAEAPFKTGIQSANTSG